MTFRTLHAPHFVSSSRTSGDSCCQHINNNASSKSPVGSFGAGNPHIGLSGPKEDVSTFQCSCLGFPAPGVEISVIAAAKENGRENEGGVGEVLTRGPHVMLRYWGDEGATAQVGGAHDHSGQGVGGALAGLRW